MLWVILDDLRPQLAWAYGQQASMASLTPSFDRLAREGTTFTRAYAQQAICGPSRNSFLSGRRPDRIRTYTFESSFRDAPGGLEMLSLPQAFKQAGYVSCGVGKTYHDDAIFSPPSYDLPLSWSPECGDYFVAPRDSCSPGEILCSVPGHTADDYEDSRVVRHAAGLMDRVVAARRAFLLVIGLRRPHLPWAVPAEVARRMPPASELAVARHRTAARGAPALAYFHCYNEGGLLREMLEQPALGVPAPAFNATSPLPLPAQQALRRGYYAAVAWADVKLGELLGALERRRLANSTLVLVHGDHGWHLGEHGMWCKEANTELATRVPLIVRDGRAAARGWGGARQHAIVELVDLYATLCEVAGVPVQPGVDGRSFASVLLPSSASSSAAAAAAPAASSAPGARRNGHGHSSLSSAAAFSQYPRCYGEGEGGMVLCAVGQSVGDEGDGDGDGDGEGGGEGVADVELHSWIDVMGLSMRVAGWRLTAWYPWDKRRGAPRFGAEPGAVPIELYQHPHDESDASDLLDATENVNLAGARAHTGVQEALHRRLLDHFVPLARRATPHSRRGVARRLAESAPPLRGSGVVEEEREGRRRLLGPFAMLQASLRAERSRRWQRRRQRGVLLATRKLGRRRGQTRAPSALLPGPAPEAEVPIELGASSAS